VGVVFTTGVPARAGAPYFQTILTIPSAPTAASPGSHVVLGIARGRRWAIRRSPGCGSRCSSPPGRGRLRLRSAARTLPRSSSSACSTTRTTSPACSPLCAPPEGRNCRAAQPTKYQDARAPMESLVLAPCEGRLDGVVDGGRQHNRQTTAHQADGKHQILGREQHRRTTDRQAHDQRQTTDLAVGGSVPRGAPQSPRSTGMPLLTEARPDHL
jgi:hypothetical protein